jgi:lipoyl(octanoyl) transferase
LASKGIAVRFVGRGGGAVLHGPGQVGIALFAPLSKLGLSSYDVGGFLERFEFGLESAIQSLRCSTARDSRQPGIFGRSGLVAAVSFAIRRGVVWHGGFVNVCPDLGLYRRIDTVPVATGIKKRTMGSVQAEIRRKVRLQDARTAIVRSLADAFGCGDVSIQSGVPIFQNTETRTHIRTNKSA